MSRHVVVGVDDSEPALAAAAVAIDIARLQPTEVTFVAVAEPGVDPTPVLAHVERLATHAGITATTIACDRGPAFEAILAEAHRVRADLIVVGRSDKQRPGAPRVGSQTGHLIEFTDVPVLVVPATSGSRPGNPIRSSPTPGATT